MGIRSRLASKWKGDVSPIVIAPAKINLVSRLITVSSKKQTTDDDDDDEDEEEESESSSETEPETFKTPEANSPVMSGNEKESDENRAMVRPSLRSIVEQNVLPTMRTIDTFEERASIRTRLASRLKNDDLGEKEEKVSEPKSDSWFKTLKAKARSKKQSVEQIVKVDKRKSVEKIEKVDK